MPACVTERHREGNAEKEVMVYQYHSVFVAPAVGEVVVLVLELQMVKENTLSTPVTPDP